MGIPITLVGNLTDEPTVKVINNGQAVSSMSIAVNERVQKNGEWIDGETTFYRVSIFGKLAEAFTDKARKGDLVIAAGNLKISNYEKDGVKRSAVEVVAKHIGIVPKPGRQERRDEESSSW